MMKRLFFYTLISLVTVFTACDDNDSFSADRGNLLTFPADTLMMDTVFSTVPSSTRMFWIYNNSGDGIRMKVVRLERGNQSGFRVNVDGTYLDNSTGSVATDLEVREGDSIRVFMEVTAPVTGKPDPTIVEDNLLFTLESGVVQKVNIRAWAWDAILLDSMIVKRDTTIQSAKPVVVRRGLKVDSTATLTINAPMTLYFRSGAGVDVYGNLVVNGRAGDDVVFRGDRLDRMFDYLPYDRVSGQWKGIRFHSSSTRSSRLSYADIHSSEYGIVCDSAEYDANTFRLTLDHVTIHNCKGAGLQTFNSHLLASNCQITNTLGDCMAVYGGRALVVYCTLAQFYPFDANRGVALRFTNFHGDYNYPLHAMECYNTLVTGYADDVIMGETKDSTALFAYRFENCILRTPTPEKQQENSPFINTIFENPDSIQGSEHFVDINADDQYYDFHLDSLSMARKKAVALRDFRDDRDGVARPDSADIGCYQYVEKQSVVE